MLQALHKQLLTKIDEALEVNRTKLEDLNHPKAWNKRKFSFWKIYKGAYFKDQRGKVGYNCTLSHVYGTCTSSHTAACDWTSVLGYVCDIIWKKGK